MAMSTRLPSYMDIGAKMDFLHLCTCFHLSPNLKDDITDQISTSHCARTFHAHPNTMHPSAGHLTRLCSLCTPMKKLYRCTRSGGHVTWSRSPDLVNNEQNVYCTGFSFRGPSIYERTRSVKQQQKGFARKPIE